MRIDNPQQLRQLELSYASVQGAMAIADAAGIRAREMANQYLSQVSMLTGLRMQDGTSVSVDFETGEVELTQHALPTMNGVAA